MLFHSIDVKPLNTDNGASFLVNLDLENKRVNIMIP